MSKIVACIMLGLILYCTACKKDNGAGTSGTPISTDTEAKAAFARINTVYTGLLKAKLTKAGKTFTNTILLDSGSMKITATGSYSTTAYNGTSGSTSSSTISATVTFQQYRSADLLIDGPIVFYEYHNSRTDCSASGCATATHASTIYSTTDTIPGAAIKIAFESNGKRYSDNITFRGSKEFSTFSVIMKNAKGDQFSVHY